MRAATILITPLVNRSGPIRILLVSCYDLGRQPVALASAGAFLEQAGHQVDYLDLAIDENIPDGPYRLIAFSTPMHTALRVAVDAAEASRRTLPGAHITFFGYYGWLNAGMLFERSLADSVLGGEPEQQLLDLANRLAAAGAAKLPESRLPPMLTRPNYPVPNRVRLPALERYARFLEGGQTRLAGAVETTRGCKVLCTHCPIPPVYGGKFLAIPMDVVMADIANLVEAGAEHITFADPDFLNGPTHAKKVVGAMHERFPDLTFDFTARVRHVLDNRAILAEFARCGARFAVSAVESLNERVLRILDKGHTPEEAREAVRVLQDQGIPMRPSLLPFNPWSTLSDYEELLDWVEEENLALNVDPVQFSIRLLVPPGSLLAEHPEMTPYLLDLDQDRLCYTWSHPDPRMDRLHRNIATIVEHAARSDEDPYKTYSRIRSAFDTVAGKDPTPSRIHPAREAHGPPRLTENWFC
ncbi:MAG: radical SAM protein [Acidobacteria bacterium]|uniref:Radical SAM protein n=1 Tax=Candidatus Polarisedimenticola svalbardensis TaxID=2886004 RepID=A0A8J6Y0N1_9BACT|nr:radical SAM protein [Candidatus Polarisedimenticola svalbardensis]